MRRLALFLVGPALVLAGGCAKKPVPAKRAAAADVLRELGRPWPVLVGEFHGPPRIVRHDEERLEFTVGSVRYLLDYVSRRLTRLRAGSPPRPAEALWGHARFEDGERRRLVLIRQDGQRTTVSEAAIAAAGEGFAQTADLAGLVFYEQIPGRVQLVYLDQAAGSRAVWRSMTAAPPGASLAWSPGGRYLLEAAGGRLIAYERTTGAVVGWAEGTAPAFSPAGFHLLYRKPDGRQGVIDLRSGIPRTVPLVETGYQPLAGPVWTPDETRLLFQAEAAPASPAGKSPYLLYAFQPLDGGLLRYPLNAPLDLPRFAPLLQADRARLPRLLALIPRLARGPLAVFAPAGYLVGEGGRVLLLDTASRLTALHEFADRVSLLSVGGNRRLALVTRGDKYRLYAWRLPDRTLLGQAGFPDRSDLRLGGLRLGMRREEVGRMLGRPAAVEERTDPIGGKETLSTLRYTDQSLTFTKGRLNKIISTRTAVPTGRGVAVGDSLSAVYDRYGKPDYQRGDYLSYQGILDGKTVKAAFTLDKQRRVTAILISLDLGRS